MEFCWRLCVWNILRGSSSFECRCPILFVEAVVRIELDHIDCSYTQLKWPLVLYKGTIKLYGSLAAIEQIMY